MADFSKEYCETYDPEFPYDFSVISIFTDLNEGYYYPIICEGYGFVAIRKYKGVCQVAFVIDNAEEDEQQVRWIPFDQVTRHTSRLLNT
jgi:hypothetical protein